MKVFSISRHRPHTSPMLFGGVWSAVVTLSLLALAGCSSSNRTLSDTEGEQVVIAHATLLKMSQSGDATLCTIVNPWNPKHVLHQYVLTNSDSVAALWPNYTPIRVPLQRATLTNACHAYLSEELQALDQVAVLCEAEYSASDSVRQRLADQRMADGGNSMAPNIEILLSRQTDGIWISPFENCGLGSLEKLHAPIIYCADYMESDPLARAEWMKFYGRLLGRAHQADSLFQVVVNNYNYISQKVAADSLASPHKPVVLSEYATGATWYVPGGCSSLGILYADAGADYPWHNDRHAGSLSLSPEAVLHKAADCDLWFIKYYDPKEDWTLREFIGQHPYYKLFKAAQNGQIYGCNSAHSRYFEETPFRPDLLLKCIYGIVQQFNGSMPSLQQADSTRTAVPADSSLLMIPDVPYFERLQ